MWVGGRTIPSLEADAGDDIERARLLELEGLERRQVLPVGVTHAERRSDWFGQYSAPVGGPT